MTSETMRQLGDDVRSGRRNQEKRGAIRELNVAGAPIFFLVIEARHHGILRERLQGEWRDELRCILRHDDENIMTLLEEEARELRGFVGGDRAGHAEDNGFPRAY